MSGPTTRREALTGLAVAASIGTIPAVALGNGVNRSAWDAAMRRFNELKPVEKAADERWHTAADAYEAITGHHPLKPGACRPLDTATAQLCGYTQTEHQVEVIADHRCAIESDLLEMPAPDGAALLWKLERLFGPDTIEGEAGERYGAAWCERWIEAFMADARRLLSVGRA